MRDRCGVNHHIRSQGVIVDERGLRGSGEVHVGADYQPGRFHFERGVLGSFLVRPLPIVFTGNPKKPEIPNLILP